MNSKITFLFLAFGLLAFNPLTVKSVPEDTDALLTKANSSFDAQNYSEALVTYESLYASGVFTEKMLYRLAFMHENLKNYPEAIYYLKKIRQEFGGTAVENKIKQLLQAQGATKFYSASGWDSYLQFFSHYGWLVWGITLLSGGYLVYFFLTFGKGQPSWKRLAFGIALLPFLCGTGLLYLRGFAMPDRAVVITETSFYEFPSFAASYDAKALPIGETVNILDHEDIWTEVGVGEDTYWVPEWTIRKL